MGLLLWTNKSRVHIFSHSDQRFPTRSFVALGNDKSLVPHLKVVIPRSLGDIRNLALTHSENPSPLLSMYFDRRSLDQGEVRRGCFIKTNQNKKGLALGQPFLVLKHSIIRNQTRKFLRKCVSKARIGYQTGLPCRSFELVCCRLLGGSA